VPSLLVIRGADQGKRFELHERPQSLGRDGSNPIRLHDHEVSRRHAELRPGEDAVRVVDLGSANGTFVNGRPIDQAALRSGDQLQLGQTVLVFDAGTRPPSARDLTRRVDLLALADPGDRSAIIRSLPAADGARLLGAPESAGEFLKQRLANLAVMYQATRAVSHILDTEALLPQILQLVFDSVGADRGAVLLRDADGQLVPKAVKWRGPDPDPDERLTISRSIVEHVLTTGEGVLTSDAPADQRFTPGESIVDFGIREALCVPIQGRHSSLGVLYADVRGSGEAEVDAQGKNRPKPKLTQEQLALMVAIGHQAGLAIESTTFYQAKLQAERLAAVGQTIATLSHHIKNILQGIKGGSYLIDLGLDQKDEAVVRRGWGIVEKNQAKIYDLVMDMLSISKDREPAIEEADLNGVVADCVELMAPRAAELNVALGWRPGADLPAIGIDPEGIHRAVLNLITNAIDATEDRPGAKVEVSTTWDAVANAAQIVVADNGEGIAEEDVGGLFQLFASTKGTRGTGLGLPVSQKIVREHGGKIAVESRVGRGSTFTIELPNRPADPPIGHDPADGGDPSATQTDA